ncbi:MAG: hypothetical protein PHS68_05715 [Candidatus Izemoplasmatales bacterium]|nr:hypothetical protein [Candidatus Izemoplasmatales bacterium]
MTSKQDYYRQKQQEWDSKGGKFAYWKPKPGENVIRILPPFNPESPLNYPEFDPDNLTTHFFREYEYVFKCGAAGRKIIPRTQFGLSDDPFEAYRASLEKRAHAGDKAAAGMLRNNTPQKAVGMWIIDRNNEEAGPQFWETTLNNMKAIVSICADPWFGDIDRPVPDKNGRGARDLKVIYTPKEKAKNGFAKYEFIADPQTSKLHNDDDKMLEWLSTDLWQKYPNVCGPSDVGYIQAVIDDKVDEYFASKRDEQHGEPEPPTDGSRWWVFLMGQAVQLPVWELQERIDKGEKLQIMPLDQSSSWADASEYGFDRTREPEAPQPPPSPSTPPVPQSAPSLPTPKVPSTPPVAPQPPSIPGANTPPQHPIPSDLDALNRTVQAISSPPPTVPAAEMEKLLA